MSTILYFVIIFYTHVTYTNYKFSFLFFSCLITQVQQLKIHLLTRCKVGEKLKTNKIESIHFMPSTKRMFYNMPPTKLSSTIYHQITYFLPYIPSPIVNR